MSYGRRIGLLTLVVTAGVFWSSLASAQRNYTERGVQSLGLVTIGQDVLADGKPLKSGRYEVRLLPERPRSASGEDSDDQRWAEFIKGDKVVGREVVSVVSRSEIAAVARDAPPKPGGARVQLLDGDAYVRVWIFRGGLHYLIHLPTGREASRGSRP